MVEETSNTSNKTKVKLLQFHTRNIVQDICVIFLG